MAEASKTDTWTPLVKLVHESLEDCKEFWETMEEQPNLMNMIEFTGKFADVVVQFFTS